VKMQVKYTAAGSIHLLILCYVPSSNTRSRETNMCSLSHICLIPLQEKPNDIPEGETPHAVVMHVFEANVDVCR
jgi:DNA replicative helicase MCM subunit Mcm2 (Cdc46/Mcm family)